LVKADPSRVFHMPSIRTLFPDLAKAGAIRKVRRAAGGFVHWAAAELEVGDKPIAAMKLSDAAEVVLGEVGPLTAAESLKERGYRPDAEPRVLLVSVRDAFKRNRSRFSRGDGGQWVVQVP
jgi:hypothetical protein